MKLATAVELSSLFIFFLIKLKIMLSFSMAVMPGSTTGRYRNSNNGNLGRTFFLIVVIFSAYRIAYLFQMS